MNIPALKTGFFLGSGILLIGAVGLVLAKLDVFAKTTPYTVSFAVRDGVLGLSKGSDVRIGGLVRGSVTSVVPVLDAGGQISSIDVQIAFDSGVVLHTDAVAMRMMPLLGTSAWLNFSSLGSTEEPVLQANGSIKAIPSGGVLAAIVGLTNATKADQMIDDALKFAAFLASVPQEYQTRIVPILDSAQVVVADFRTDYTDWRIKVSGALVAAAESMKKLDATMGMAQQLLERDGPKIDSTISNLDSAVLAARDTLTHLNQTTMPLLDTGLSKAEAAVDSIEKSMEIVHTLLLERTPDISETLSNIRTAAGQLKLAALEIRRSPWKILYQPSTDQVAHENLYDAARSFAMAAGDLRAAGDSLRLVIERDPGRYETDMKFREAVQTSVMDALDKYQRAQQQLNDVLMGPAPAGESQAK
ncbi:MAG: hypothetical protein EXS03_05440 [Phycisphaerales bacterium]|nr:hypothetical protein [Phycisphaerales bacterium]